MFVRVKATPNSPRRSVQIVESRRTGAKISQVILRHVGIALNDHEEQELLRLAELIRVEMESERSQTLPLFAPEEIAGHGVRKQGRQRGTIPAKIPIEDVRLVDVREQQRVIEGIPEVFGKLYEQLGFDKILPSTNDVLKATVLARIANPVSKHRTAALLEQDFGVTIPLEKIYRMMDGLYDKREFMQEIVRTATIDLFQERVDVAFFDVTTLYFESTKDDELRKFGYSKDQKYHCVQVVLALATTEQGLPLGYRLFHGATAEVKTLLECIDAWRSLVKIGQITFVADRGMMSEANLKTLDDRGIDYVVAASLRKLPHERHAEILGDEGYLPTMVDNDFTWVKEFSLTGKRRLIGSFSARRATKDISDRKRIVEKLQKKIGIKKRKKHSSVKKLVSNAGYLKLISTEGHQEAIIDEEKIARDAQWDGMYGIITNTLLTPQQVLARYRRLWTIEQAFRISKHDLAMRPIYHFKPERIEAHVSICYMAYALLRHAQYRVGIQQKHMSVEHLCNELLTVQASIVKDNKGGGYYRIPSRMSEDAKAIYRAFGISRSTTPSALS